MKKALLICPYFGDVPSWYTTYTANVRRNLVRRGFDMLVAYDEEEFRERVQWTLGITPPPMWGTGKIWDYRPALGLLYQDVLSDYEFWGHTDFDCVYGRVDKWMTREFLDSVDIFSNCLPYMNGCWSLYRNEPSVNTLFQKWQDWRERMTDPTPNGWAEAEFSDLVRASGQQGDLRVIFAQWQVFSERDLEALSWQDDRLMRGRHEVMMAHFRRTKVYPPGCVR